MKMNNYFGLLFSAAAFSPPDAGWKMTEDGKIDVKDGNPVWVDPNGGERILDGNTIQTLNGEAAKLRRDKEAAEARAREYEGIDAKKAREALELASKIDQKMLIDAGKVDEVKNQITSQFTAQLQEKDNALNQLQSRFDNMTVSTIFANSEFIREKIAVPRDMFEAAFRPYIKLNGDKVEYYGRDGNQLMSSKKIGEYVTDPEEAFELLVAAHPNKDAILKADDAIGSGSNGNGGTRGGKRVIKVSEFRSKSPQERLEISRKIKAGEMGPLVEG